MMSDENLTPGSPSPQRSEDIERGAALARKRAEQEAALKVKIAERKKSDAQSSEHAMMESIEKKQEDREKKQEFRTMKKGREQEIIEDKARRERETKQILAAQEGRAARRKEQQGYMKELHDTARIKQAMEDKKIALKAEAERARIRAEREHRRAIDEAERKAAERKIVAERDAASRKATVETELKAALYQLESAHRSKLTAFDNEMRRQLSDLVARPGQDQRAKFSLELTLKTRRRAIESEIKEAKTTAENEARRKILGITNDLNAERVRIDAEMKQTIQAADREWARALEDIDRPDRRLRGGTTSK